MDDRDGAPVGESARFDELRGVMLRIRDDVTWCRQFLGFILCVVSALVIGLGAAWLVIGRGHVLSGE